MAARAQVSFGLAPAMVVRSFRPGQPFAIELDVSNGSPSPVLMRGVVTDWWYNEQNEKVFAPPGSLPRSACNWLEFVPRQFIVPGNGSFRVKVIVTPPANASGGNYCVAFVESKPELAQAATAENKAVFTNVRLGSLLLLTAEKTEDYRIRVSDAQFSPPDARRNLALDFLLENQSNTHIFPRVELALLNTRQELVARAAGDMRRFLPGQKQRLAVTWAGVLPPENYTAILTIVYGGEKIYTQEFPFQAADEP